MGWENCNATWVASLALYAFVLLSPAHGGLLSNPKADAIHKTDHLQHVAQNTHTFQAYDNYDPTSADLRSLSNIDLQACTVACQSDNQCQAYSYNKWSRQCSLKATVGQLRFEPSSVAGVSGSLPSTTDLPWEITSLQGQSLNATPYRTLASTAYDQCTRSCQDDAQCVALSYVAKQQTCKLFQAVAGYSADQGVDSGIKRQSAILVAAPPAASAAQSSSPRPANSIPAACDKPDAMGLARVVEIDTTGGPAFGFKDFKQYDFLREHEVVLTFDDGPWPERTPAVLKALTDQCLKATFFEIGLHATWHPEISKMVAEAGMTIGSHTWSHKNLANKPYTSDIEQAKREIEMGMSAVHAAVDGPIAPFFRFPDLRQPPVLLSYLAERNIATFSTDIDSFDFEMRQPEQVIKSVMSQLEKRGKGIVLMHDFQQATADAMPELLRQLKAAGFKIVHIVPKASAMTIARYDEMVREQNK